MQTRSRFRISTAAAMFLIAGSAFADNFSFTGSFTQDNQLQVFNFNLASASTVTFQTFGYAGGTNAAGQTIVAGGFDPWLSLFDSTGALLDQNDNGAGVAIDPNTGSGLDSLFTDSLGAGNYTLVLSQYDNGPIGLTFADGFLEQGTPNFTAMFMCSNGIFCDSTFVAPYDNRTGNWAVDIDNVTSASTPGAGVPEPGSVSLASLILLAGLIGLRGMAKANAVRP